MSSVVLLPGQQQADVEPVEILIADDDRALRSLVTMRVHDAVEPVTVFEAADGAEAIQIGLQRRPQIALLDVNMPRLGGLEAARVLGELLPGLRLALQTAEPSAHGERARELGLPLFDKLELERTLAWVAGQARSCARARHGRPRQRVTLACSGCGYGIAAAVPPERCPMCRRERSWVRTLGVGVG